MKGFRALIFLGVALVTLLIVIDYIDAAKKESRLRENEPSHRKLEGFKSEKSKKSNSKKSIRFEEDVNTLKETKKYKVKRGTSYTTKDSHLGEGSNPKIIKSHQSKVKKYKVVKDDNPSQTLSSTSTSKVKSSKTSQDNEFHEGDHIQEVIDELNRMHNKDAYTEENNNKKKFRVVDVTLMEEEDDEKQESEAYNEKNLNKFVRSTEEVFDKTKITTAKYPREKRAARISPEEENQNEDTANEEEYTTTTTTTTEENLEPEPTAQSPWDSPKYEDPANPTCIPKPRDPNRKCPRKLTFYVIEENIDGEFQKRLIAEPDGLTFCEVADLLAIQYGRRMEPNE